jgi:protein TonB
METKTAVYQSWDDLIFENRNKAYGAYVLRKSYGNQVMLGFGITVAFFAILLLLPKGAHVERVVPKITDVIILSDEPQVIKNTPVTRRPPAQPRQHTENRPNTTPIITTVPVTPTTDVTPVDNTSVVDNGIGVGDATDAFTGTGTDVAVQAIDTQKEFVRVEIMPVYEGGDKALFEFLSRKMRYPNVPRRMGIEGTVFVSFLVKGDGTVADVNVVRGIHPDCDKEAVRVISMLPGWIGGKQSGYPVSVRMVLPIKFQLR